jgi:hypothetical protein
MLVLTSFDDLFDFFLIYPNVRELSWKAIGRKSAKIIKMQLNRLMWSVVAS